MIVGNRLLFLPYLRLTWGHYVFGVKRATAERWLRQKNRSRFLFVLFIVFLPVETPPNRNRVHANMSSYRLRFDWRTTAFILHDDDDSVIIIFQ